MFDFLGNIIGWPLGWLLYLCYSIVRNYGFAILLFTIITKVILLPLSIKQHKNQVRSTAVQARMRPKLEEIQKKYANNKQKLQEEQAKLYQEENFNPLSGCLPMLIQLPILWGLYAVVYRPITYIARIGTSAINSAIEVTKEIVSSQTGQDIAKTIVNEIDVIKYALNPDFSNMFANIEGFNLDKIADLNFWFFGLDILSKPEFALSVSVLLPIISGLTSLLYSKIIQKQNAQTMGQSSGSMNFMSLLLMPAMSLFIAFQVPGGLVLYWIFSNIVMLAQSLILYRFYNPKKMIEEINAKAEEEAEKRRAERKAKQAKYVERKYGKTVETTLVEGSENEEVDESMLSAREIEKRKIAEARRRMAEKYGDGEE